MEMKKVEKRFQEVKKKLTEKFNKKGLNKDQIKTEFNSIDTEFLTHAFVNGKFSKEDRTNSERLDFYVRFLELKLKE